jgi:biopolymer transport protein ExbD
MNMRILFPMVDLMTILLFAYLPLANPQVRAIPVNVARVGGGASVVQRGDFCIMTLSEDGLTLDGEQVDPDHLAGQVVGRRVILRVDQSIPTGETTRWLGVLSQSGTQVSIEVQESQPRH